MTYILPSQGFRFLLHHCGCVTVKLRGVEAVAPVHMDRKLEHYDPRDRDGYKYTKLASDSRLPSHALLLHLFPQSRSLALSLLSVLDSTGSSISCY